MTRVLSALILLPVVLAIIWLMPPIATLVLAEFVLLLALIEYVSLVDRLGAQVSRATTMTGAAVSCAALYWPGAPVDVTLMTTMVAMATIALVSGRTGAGVLHDLSAALFATLYLALPLGALAGIRVWAGREALLLLLLTVMASDTAQYYGGRLFGRHLLSPVISPNKTVEGVIAGLIAGSVAMAIVGRWWLPAAGTERLLLLGATVVAAGITGDLFESMLKRRAGIKDTSALIPGHGGILDRIDSLLFSAPVYYVFLKHGM